MCASYMLTDMNVYACALAFIYVLVCVFISLCVCLSQRKHHMCRCTRGDTWGGGVTNVFVYTCVHAYIM